MIQTVCVSSIGANVLIDNVHGVVTEAFHAAHADIGVWASGIGRPLIHQLVPTICVSARDVEAVQENVAKLVSPSLRSIIGSIHGLWHQER